MYCADCFVSAMLQQVALFTARHTAIVLDLEKGELSALTQTHLLLMYNSSTLALAHGVFLKNFKLDLMLGS
jgi:hypothetical protein